jgi:hypothetical protein
VLALETALDGALAYLEHFADWAIGSPTGPNSRRLAYVIGCALGSSDIVALTVQDPQQRGAFRNELAGRLGVR